MLGTMLCLDMADESSWSIVTRQSCRLWEQLTFCFHVKIPVHGGSSLGPGNISLVKDFHLLDCLCILSALAVPICGVSSIKPAYWD